MITIVRPRLASEAFSPLLQLGKEGLLGWLSPTPHSPVLPGLRERGRAGEGAGGGAGKQGTRGSLPGLGSRSLSSAVPRALKPGGSAGPIRSLAMRGSGRWSRTQTYHRGVKPTSKAARDPSPTQKVFPAPTNDVSACGWLSRVTEVTRKTGSHSHAAFSSGRVAWQSRLAIS